MTVGPGGRCGAGAMQGLRRVLNQLETSKQGAPQEVNRTSGSGAFESWPAEDNRHTLDWLGSEKDERECGRGWGAPVDGWTGSCAKQSGGAPHNRRTSSATSRRPVQSRPRPQKPSSSPPLSFPPIISIHIQAFRTRILNHRQEEKTPRRPSPVFCLFSPSLRLLF